MISGIIDHKLDAIDPINALTTENGNDCATRTIHITRKTALRIKFLLPRRQRRSYYAT